MNLGCVVLAAGRSSRFGENKLLNPLKGRAVLARVLDSLPRERFERITVVAASEGVEQLCRERQLQCLRYSGGTQSESIRLGIRAMTGLEGCLFVMGDQPLCARASMERMVEEFMAHPRAVVRLAWGKTPCSPVLFPQCCFSALEKLTGERGGMSALKGLEPEIRLVQAEDEAELWDVDTKEDLSRIECWLDRYRQK